QETTTASIAAWARPISTKRTPDRELLEELFRVATEAVAPERLIQRHLQRDGGAAALHGPSQPQPVKLPLPIFVAGVGKAAARMASGCERLLGNENVRGLVI